MKNQLQRDEEPALHCPSGLGSVAVMLTVPERRWWGGWRQVTYVVTDLGYWRHAERTVWFHPSVQPRGLHAEVQARFEEWALGLGLTWRADRLPWWLR